MPARHQTELQKLAARLKATRESMGLSQAKFSTLVDVSSQAWNNYETGFRRISLDQAIKVCDATGVSLDWIYRGVLAGVRHELAMAIQQLKALEQSNKGDKGRWD
ncbi:helix-turn-helix transcriptional regulator [Bradyrhizobium sp. 6(2017)]|uniref:helix-turn-helix transcriptional regulator n=1 Tax=Bradyrhizobium sp. 6(2017) TaxID=1197460 RepID=UPI0013E1B5F3|nr:helix-turn-helix transcriptional regulator [Bradyrhizobium sp. 6(2017)]QIG92184.1 helix-turn-helix transcriptional regulator [Bradyrhizobium sp. 6(2017)]